MSDKIIDINRLNEIVRLDLHNPKTDAVLDGYMNEISIKLNIPYSLITVILDTSQLFIASFGLTGWSKKTKGTPIEWSFCIPSIETKKPYSFENALENPKHKDNPLVINDGVRCYLGVPLITKNDFVIGNLCIIGGEPRAFNDDEVSFLEGYALLIMKRLEDRIA